MSKPLKVLIVDDTITYRHILTEALSAIHGIELAGTASNGRNAIEKLARTPVDLVLLDIEMPEMNGLETLQVIRKEHPNTGVIMISGMHKSSADITIKALEAGALDFIPKPSNDNAQANLTALRQQLIPMFRLFSAKQRVLLRRSAPPPPSSSARPVVSAAPVKREALKVLSQRIDTIVIGVSTGGPGALNQLIPSLPGNLGVPIFLVQHMPPVFTASLASSLTKKSQLKVKEAEDGEPVLPNMVYIAPGGKHMVVQKAAGGEGTVIGINNDPPENSCRPAADVLFRSASKIYGRNILAIVMTGMGNDGALGVKAMKQVGCYCITQSADSCVVYGMPKAVDDMGLSDEQVALDHLAGRVTTLVQKSLKAAN